MSAPRTAQIALFLAILGGRLRKGVAEEKGPANSSADRGAGGALALCERLRGEKALAIIETG